METRRRSFWPWGWTHRDTIWLLILVITVSVLITAISWAETDTTAYLSFASTVLSIILAVFAIFYTMIQASESSQVMNLVREKLDKVSQDTGTLIKVLPYGGGHTTPGLAGAEPVKPPRSFGNGPDPASTVDPFSILNRILLEGMAQLRPDEKPLVNQGELFDAMLRSDIPPSSAFRAILLYRSMDILRLEERGVERHLLIDRGRLSDILRAEDESKPRLFAP